MKRVDKYKGSMEELVAMNGFLESMGYDIDDLTFQEAVNLMGNLKKVICNFPTTKDK